MPQADAGVVTQHFMASDIFATSVAVRLFGLLALGPGYFDQTRTGDVVMSLVEGVEQLETFFGQYFPQFAIAALTPLLIFAFMAAFDVQTAYVFLAFALFTLILPLLTTGWTGESRG